MKSYYKIVFSLFFACISQVGFSQKSINDESFSYLFKKSSNGAQVAFIGKSHSFVFDIKDKAVRELETKGAPENQKYFQMDKESVQISWVPIPQPLPTGVELGKLTDEQYKAILSEYADYELDYAKEMKVKISHVTKEWFTINGRLFFCWCFDMDNVANNNQSVKSQVYLGSICFNRVVVVNAPVTDKKDFDRLKEFVKAISSSLTLYDKRVALPN